MIWKSLKAILGIIGIIIGAIFAADNFVIERVQTRVAEPLKKEMLAYRSADFQHFDGKIDKIDRKLDELKEIVQDKR